jgi:hypothetical protein
MRFAVESDNKQKLHFLILTKREVQLKRSQQLRDVVSNLHHDTQLQIDRAIIRLLITEAHLVMRFAQYLAYPTRLWELTKEWNPQRFASCVEDFLLAPQTDLDAGYSMQLQQDAFSRGGAAGITPGGISYLMSAPIQNEIVGLLRAGAATSTRNFSLADAADCKTYSARNMYPLI